MSNFIFKLERDQMGYKKKQKKTMNNSQFWKLSKINILVTLILEIVNDSTTSQETCIKTICDCIKVRLSSSLAKIDLVCWRGTDNIILFLLLLYLSS